jgi:hypothetical protein
MSFFSGVGSMDTKWTARRVPPTPSRSWLRETAPATEDLGSNTPKSAAAVKQRLCCAVGLAFLDYPRFARVWRGEGAMKRLILLTSVLLMVGSAARSQLDIATDTELRVAYCLGVTEQFASDFTGPKSPSWGLPEDDALVKVDRDVAQYNAAQRARLLDYLRARGLLTEERSITAKTGVVAAKRRGMADFVEHEAMSDKCVSKCSAKNPSYSQECVDSCLKESPIHGAILRCRDNDPLPY